MTGRNTVSVAVLSAVLLATGCLPVLKVTTRTRIAANGTTVRETTIVKERRKPHDDRERLFNERPVVEDLAKSLGDGFAEVVRTDDTITLSGVFAHPSQVPADFQRDVPEFGQARNRIAFSTADVLFGTHFVYQEHYVDAVRPEDLKDAKREAVEFATRLVRAVARDEFGDQYDRVEFDRWTRTQLADTLADLIAIYWEERRHLSGKKGLDRAIERTLKRLARLGLDLDVEADQVANIDAVKSFAVQVLASTLRPAAGRTRPVSEADVAYLFASDDPVSIPPALQIAIDRTIERDFGTRNAFDREWRRILIGLNGTFGSPPAEAEFRFDCAVEMPGRLLRTNGNIEGTRSAFWVFEGAAIFPEGQVLQAESFLADPSLLGRIRELKNDVNERDAARLIDALEGVSVEQRTALRAALERCARLQTLEALDAEDSQLVKTLAPVLDVMRK